MKGNILKPNTQDILLLILFCNLDASCPASGRKQEHNRLGRLSGHTSRDNKGGRAELQDRVQRRQAVDGPVVATRVGRAEKERRPVPVQGKEGQHYDSLGGLVSDRPEARGHPGGLRLYETQERVQGEHVQQQRVLVSDVRPRVHDGVDQGHAREFGAARHGQTVRRLQVLERRV